MEAKGGFEAQPPQGHLAPNTLSCEFSLLNPTARDMAQPPPVHREPRTGDESQGDSRSQLPTSIPDGAGPV